MSQVFTWEWCRCRCMHLHAFTTTSCAGISTTDMETSVTLQSNVPPPCLDYVTYNRSDLSITDLWSRQIKQQQKTLWLRTDTKQRHAPQRHKKQSKVIYHKMQMTRPYHITMINRAVLEGVASRWHLVLTTDWLQIMRSTKTITEIKTFSTN